MLKNAFVKSLREAGTKGRQQGIIFGLDLCVVALHNVYGFGEERISRLEDEVQRLLDEMNGANDPDLLGAFLARELIAIRGEEAKNDLLKRYINL